MGGIVDPLEGLVDSLASSGASVSPTLDLNPRHNTTDQSSDLQLAVVTVAGVAHPKAADLEQLFKITAQGFCQIVWASQNPSKPCSEMLRGLEVVQTNNIPQALNHTIQVQSFEVLLGIQLHTHAVHLDRPLAGTAFDSDPHLADT